MNVQQAARDIDLRALKKRLDAQELQRQVGTSNIKHLQKLLRTSDTLYQQQQAKIKALEEENRNQAQHSRTCMMSIASWPSSMKQFR